MNSYVVAIAIPCGHKLGVFSYVAIAYLVSPLKSTMHCFYKPLLSYFAINNILTVEITIKIIFIIELVNPITYRRITHATHDYSCMLQKVTRKFEVSKLQHNV